VGVFATVKFSKKWGCSTFNIACGRGFSDNNEPTFQLAPSIRQLVDCQFCLFGPMTIPHALARILLEARTMEQIDSAPLWVSIQPGPWSRAGSVILNFHAEISPALCSTQMGCSLRLRHPRLDASSWKVRRIAVVR
jgi:hypothetical protein